MSSFQVFSLSKSFSFTAFHNQHHTSAQVKENSCSSFILYCLPTLVSKNVPDSLFSHSDKSSYYQQAYPDSFKTSWILLQLLQWNVVSSKLKACSIILIRITTFNSALSEQWRSLLIVNAWILCIIFSFAIAQSTTLEPLTPVYENECIY